MKVNLSRLATWVWWFAKKSSRGSVLIVLIVASCVSSVFAQHDVQKPQNKKPQEAFMGVLNGLCGERFAGEMTYPKSGQDSFAGKLLVATFAQCSTSEVRISFDVGQDHSRTWVIRKVEGGLELKHDHRHEDGTPDDVSMYGGVALLGSGDEFMQTFPADAFTAKLIPAAATNVWSLTFSNDQQTLTYHLTRHDKPRFTAVLNREVNGG